MKHESMAELWTSFWLEVKPADAPDIQRVEMRRAFMAGAWGLLQQLRRFDDSVSEEVGAAHLVRWEQELQAFQRGVLEGRY